jgi:nucleoside phosphorylase
LGTDAKVDVLILTALQDELEAVLNLGEGGRAGWTDERDAHGFLFHRRMLGALSFSAAWTGQMGETSAAVRAQELVAELSPACLAMCGICAGRRGDVFLGDVIVADRVYSYDHGKHVVSQSGQPGTLLQDIETYNLEQIWRVDAAYFARDRALHKKLARGRPLSLASQQNWLLHTLYLHQLEGDDSPKNHRARRTLCPAWTQVLASLEQLGWLQIQGSTLLLTNAGIAHVEEQLTRNPDWPPRDPPFRVHMGALATGKTVRKDPGLFALLEHSVRKTLGVEMESAAIGYVAERQGLKLVIAKAVSDYGDGDKNDSFRSFACRASARFVVEFLLKHLPPKRSSGEPRLQVRAKRHRPIEPDEPKDPAEFSPSLIQQMKRLHKNIRRLTEEQFRVIEFLQGHTRAAIQGCAGSGKTLVAAEKALRLSRAGLRTLLLCHNPHLAHRLRALTTGSGVEVFDFESWVQVLNGVPGAGISEWMHYAEPSEAELAQAFDRLVARSDRYDAVIVDEGQDFRETWWTMVEAALKSPQAGTLYVFLDDNQTLLPHRGQPPIEQSPHKLSTNCRNAGAIFEVVRRLHTCAPDPTLVLSGQGKVERFELESEKDARKGVSLALESALRELPPDRLAVLTTESDPASQSVLEGLQVSLKLPWRWQDVVMRHLKELLAAYIGKLNVTKVAVELPTLSEEPTPTPEDVSAVNTFAKRVTLRHPVHPLKFLRARWRSDEKGLELQITSLRTPAWIGAFFAWADWSQGLPTLPTYAVSASPTGSAKYPLIPLRTVAAFKGLEVDGVVLYLREYSLGGGPRDEDPHRMSKAYVGVSRAHLSLYIVGHWSMLSKL